MFKRLAFRAAVVCSWIIAPIWGTSAFLWSLLPELSTALGEFYRDTWKSFKAGQADW